MDAIHPTEDETRVQEEVPATPAQAAAAASAVEPAAPATVQRVTTRANIAADAEQRRKVQALELQRERILSERTSSPHRRSSLAAALLDIEEQLVQLGWTIHL